MITHLQSLKIAHFYENPCITTSLFSSINIIALNERIAKCTESNKPEQKLLLAESEKKEDTAKIDSLSKVNDDLSKTITENLQEIAAMKQNAEVLHQEVNTLNKKNRELFLSDKKQLQVNEALKQKHNSDSESNQQILTKVNEKLKTCEIKIEKSHFAYKCFN